MRTSTINKLCDFLEERAENTCEKFAVGTLYYCKSVLKTSFEFYILTELTDKEYLDQLEDNLKLAASYIHEFKESQL